MDAVPGREVAEARARPRGVAQRARHAAIDSRAWLSRLPRLLWMTAATTGLVLAIIVTVQAFLPPEPKDPNLVGEAIDRWNELQRRFELRTQRAILRVEQPPIPAVQDTHVRYRGEIVPFDSLSQRRR